jgi:hypothetical protein
MNDAGVLDLLYCWLKEDWVYCHGTMSGTVNVLGGIATGTDPGFWDEGGQEFWIVETSDCMNAGTAEAPACLPIYLVELEYVKHQQRKARASNGVLDIGAYEYPHGGGVPAQVEELVVSPTAGDDLILTWVAVDTDTCGLPVQVDHYDIYSSLNAYFVCDESGLFTQVVDDTTLVVPDATQNPAENRFFRLAAERATVEGQPSDPAGEFDLGLSVRSSVFSVQAGTRHLVPTAY